MNMLSKLEQNRYSSSGSLRKTLCQFSLFTLSYQQRDTLAHKLNPKFSLVWWFH